MDYIWCVFLFISFHALLFFLQVDLLEFFNQCALIFYVQRTSCFSLFACWFQRLNSSYVSSFSSIRFCSTVFLLLSFNVAASLSVSECFFMYELLFCFVCLYFDLAIIVVVSFQVPIHRSCKIVRATFVCDDMHYILHHFSQNVRSVVFLWGNNQFHVGLNLSIQSSMIDSISKQSHELSNF